MGFLCTIVGAFAMLLPCLKAMHSPQMRGASSTAQSRADAFAQYVQLFKRPYKKGSEEYKMRQEAFETRLGAVEHHNAQDIKNWKAGVNRFSDRTKGELSGMLGWKRSARPQSSGSDLLALNLVEGSGPSVLPASMSYKHLAAMNDIKDQSMCGSCWAEASATVLRAHAQIHTKKDRTFSVQQLVSCTPNPEECGGTGGCDGATAELAMEYVLRAGCKTDEEFPYQERDVPCPKDSMPVEGATTAGGSKLGMTGWMTLPQNKAEPLQRALVTKGPAVIAAAADDSWFMYAGGIKDGCPKDTVVNHAVVLTGYGVEGSKRYWDIQNSWGEFWGENGHIRVERPDDEDTGYCGWDNDPHQGLACKSDNTTKVWVCGMCGVLYDSVVPTFAH